MEISMNKIIVIVFIVALIFLIKIIYSIIEFIHDHGVSILCIGGYLALVIGVSILYKNMGYPNIFLIIIGAILVVGNIIAIIAYLYFQGLYVQSVEWAYQIAQEIGNKKAEMLSTIQTTISDTMAKMGRGTDQEVWENVKDNYPYIDDINKKSGYVIRQLSRKGIYISDMTDFGELLCPIEEADLCKDQFHKLMDKGEIKIECKLNGSDVNAQTWDGNLYESTREDIKGENMLPTEYMSID